MTAFVCPFTLHVPFLFFPPVWKKTGPCNIIEGFSSGESLLEFWPNFYFSKFCNFNTFPGIRQSILIMPASPLDVEAQISGGGNRWLLETSYFACRVLELVSAGTILSP